MPQRKSNVLTSGVVDIKVYGPNLKGLQEQINDARAGSTLNLFNNFSTIKDKKIIKISKDMVIDGHGHTIDLAGSSGHDHYFKVTDGSVTFKNIRFINGYNKDDDTDGAIFFKSLGICTIINCTFENCWAESKAGAIFSIGELRIFNSTFLNNRVGDDGGAVYAEGNMIIHGSIFNNNSADDCGGAVDGEGAITEIWNCTFDGNAADDDDGGALWVKGNLFVRDSIFRYNVAGDCAGAIDCEGSLTEIRNSTLKGNYAHDDGGALWILGNLFVKDSFFISNVAEDSAGAIDCEGSKTEIQNSTFDGNYAYDDLLISLHYGF